MKNGNELSFKRQCWNFYSPVRFQREHQILGYSQTNTSRNQMGVEKLDLFVTSFKPVMHLEIYINFEWTKNKPWS